ncbi:MAG: Sec-independent protein translocase protein TatB [Gammaproteobacteria bacterium]
MFDIGFWELALIGVIALLVVGPERMPSLIRTTGKWVGHIQRLARDLRREIEREAQTEEFRKLNQDFLEEDRRLKASVREASATTARVQQPSLAAEDAADTGEDGHDDNHGDTAAATRPEPVASAAEQERAPSQQNA